MTGLHVGNKMPFWPRFMTLESAARYCSMTRPDFIRAVTCRQLPQPVRLDGNKFWRLPEIERHFDAQEDVWQKTRSLSI